MNYAISFTQNQLYANAAVLTKIVSMNIEYDLTKFKALL